MQVVPSKVAGRCDHHRGPFLERFCHPERTCTSLPSLQPTATYPRSTFVAVPVPDSFCGLLCLLLSLRITVASRAMLQAARPAHSLFTPQ